MLNLGRLFAVTRYRKFRSRVLSEDMRKLGLVLVTGGLLTVILDIRMERYFCRFNWSYLASLRAD